MSDEIQPVKTGWPSIQVYGLSVLCLLVGISVGYLFRGSTAPKTPDVPTAAIGQPQIPQAGAPGGSQAGSIPPGAAPSADQMKQMAEKQVAPLLAKLKADPNDSDTLVKVGSYYFAARQFDEAASYFERASKVKPSADVLTKLSNAYYYSGSPDKAIATLNQALQIDPKFANALYNLGMLKWQSQGDVKGAVECWEKLLKTNPNHPNRAQVEKMIAVVKQHKNMPAGSKTNVPAM
jgi:cytochrome c-type biogenesis protein CcmH/NrfG